RYPCFLPAGMAAPGWPERLAELYQQSRKLPRVQRQAGPCTGSGAAPLPVWKGSAPDLPSGGRQLQCMARIHCLAGNDRMMPFTFNTTPSIVFEAGASRRIAEIAGGRLGASVLLVTDPGLRALGLCDIAIDALEGAG